MMSRLFFSESHLVMNHLHSIESCPIFSETQLNMGNVVDLDLFYFEANGIAITMR